MKTGKAVSKPEARKTAPAVKKSPEKSKKKDSAIKKRPEILNKGPSSKIQSSKTGKNPAPAEVKKSAKGENGKEAPKSLKTKTDCKVSAPQENKPDKSGSTGSAQSGPTNGNKKDERNPLMICCYRCYRPFEPLAKEKLCPECEKYAEQIFHKYFGDEDPYSPQPAMRISKIARVIPRKIPVLNKSPEPANQA